MTKLLNMHICSHCKKEFKSENGYLNHRCSVTGFKPIDPEHQGENFILQSRKALERTGSLSEKESNDIKERMKRAKEAKVDEKIKIAHGKMSPR